MMSVGNTLLTTQQETRFKRRESSPI